MVWQARCLLLVHVHVLLQFAGLLLFESVKVYIIFKKPILFSGSVHRNFVLWHRRQGDITKWPLHPIREGSLSTLQMHCWSGKGLLYYKMCHTYLQGLHGSAWKVLCIYMPFRYFFPGSCYSCMSITHVPCRRQE